MQEELLALVGDGLVDWAVAATGIQRCDLRVFTLPPGELIYIGRGSEVWPNAQALKYGNDIWGNARFINVPDPEVEGLTWHALSPEVPTVLHNKEPRAWSRVSLVLWTNSPATEPLRAHYSEALEMHMLVHRLEMTLGITNHRARVLRGRIQLKDHAVSMAATALSLAKTHGSASTAITKLDQAMEGFTSFDVGMQNAIRTDLLVYLSTLNQCGRR